MQHEFITFEIAGQTFGLDIMAIREIRAWSPATRLPNVPHYIAGVVNLRGTVLPVVDLAARLGWAATEPTPRHAIIVTQVNGQTRGLIVDAVSDIVSIGQEALQPPPSPTGDAIDRFVEFLVAIEDRMVMVLDLASITDDPLQQVAA